MTDEAVELQWLRDCVMDGSLQRDQAHALALYDSLVQRLREAEERATSEGNLREQTADSLHKVILRAEAAEERADGFEQRLLLLKQHRYELIESLRAEEAHSAEMEERAEKAEARLPQSDLVREGVQAQARYAGRVAQLEAENKRLRVVLIGIAGTRSERGEEMRTRAEEALMEEAKT